MAVQDAGEGFDIRTNNNGILQITSPGEYVTGGPHDVVYKDINNRWAVVTLEWEGDPRLGIRWFYSTKGFPITQFGWAAWLVIPPMLQEPILDGLPISDEFRNKVRRFLHGEP